MSVSNSISEHVKILDTSNAAVLHFLNARLKVANAHVTLDLQRRDVVLGLGEQVHGQEPACQRQLGGFEDRAADGAALVTAGAALPVAPSRAHEHAVHAQAAGRAGKALGPARRNQRRLGMGIFFTLYYLGMALLPGIAGWFRDLTRIDAAPLLFGSALLLIAAACAVLFRRLEARPMAVAP